MAVADSDRAQAVRDLHDIVIHYVSEVRVHASVLAADATVRHASVEAILTASGSALQELRRMHAVIDPAHTISYAPQPDLDALQELLDAERPARAAAVLAGAAVPAGVVTACYRVVREVLRAVHGTMGARLDGTRVCVSASAFELWLELDDAVALELGRAETRARPLGGTVAQSDSGVHVRFPL